MCAPWKLGECGALRGITHYLSIKRVCKSGDILAGEVDGGRASYHLVSSGLVSSLRLCPGLSQGPQAECERNINRPVAWQVQVTSLSSVSHVDLSLFLWLCFH